MTTATSLVLRLVLIPTRGGATKVRACLPTDAESDEVVLEFDPEQFGIPERMPESKVDEDTFRIPVPLEAVLWEAISAKDPEVLWLQLAEPFGYLALVPWERLLRNLFNVVVVRLPTLTLTRRKPRNSLQVAVLVAVPDEHRHSELRTSLHAKRVSAMTRAPRSKQLAGPPEDRVSPEAGARHLKSGRQRADFSALEVDRLVRAVLRGSPRRNTTVHVVATPWIYHDLRKLWRAESWQNVVLHDPNALRERVQASKGAESLQPPWLRLLKEAQAGEQADVVHLLCHAHVSDSKARLVLADPLKSSIDVSSRYVSLPVLVSTLDEIGAWSLCLTSPTGSGMAAQMRYFGCRMAELRPGPTLVTDLDRDPGCAEVEAGYRFLYSPKPIAPPPLEYGMVACEPNRAAVNLAQAVSLTREVTAPDGVTPQGAAAELMAADNTPIWLAAAQRFIEQRQLELSRLEQSSRSGTQGREAAAVALGIEAALIAIQKTLAARAQEGPN